MHRPFRVVAAAIVLAAATAPAVASAASATTHTARTPVPHVRTHVDRHAEVSTGGGKGLDRGRYTARYVDTSGHPLAGVVLYATNVDSEHTVSTTSGRNGRVSLALPPAQYFIGADGDDAIGGGSDATGYVGRESLLTIHAGHVKAAGTLRLRPGGLVRVHVVNTAGAPVKGVVPTLVPVVPYVDTPDGEGFFDAYLALNAYHRTDAHGNATMRAVDPTFPFRVCVNSYSGPADATRGYLAACSSTSDLARAGRTVSTPTLTLQHQAGGTIRGIVRARRHGGFAGAYVEVREKHNVVAYGATVRGGTFEIGGLPAGTYRVCATGGSFSQAGRTGYRPGCAGSPVTVPPSLATRSSTITLRPAAAASGTVTGPHGVPVPGVDLDFTGDPTGDLEATTDARGRWVEKGLPGGPDKVCVFTDNETAGAALPSGTLGTCGHKRLVHLHASAVRRSLDFALRAAGAVSGRVVDGTGRPVPYAYVVAGEEDRETTTGRDGRFRLIGLTTGRYRICAGITDDPFFSDDTAQGCRHGEVRVRTGRIAGGTRVVVPTVSSIAVTTVDGRGRPVAGVDATAVRACKPVDCDGKGTPLLTDRNTVVAAAMTTGAHGRVQLDDLRPGRYTVCLFAYYGRARTGTPATGYRDRCSADSFDVRVRAGHSTAVRLVLDQAGTVTGRVTDADGDPLQGVLVHVQGSAADDLPAEVTEYSPDGDPYDNDDGGAAATPGYYSRTAADGTYTVRSVQPGQQLVCASPSAATGGTSQGGYLRQCLGGAVGSTHTGTPVTVTAGATTAGVDLTLTAGGTISGTVTTAIRGTKPYSYVVLLRGQDEVAQVKRRGRSFGYTFNRLAQGSYVVCVASFDGEFSVGRCYQNIIWDYPQSTSPPTDRATLVPVTSGSSTDIDIALPA